MRSTHRGPRRLAAGGKTVQDGARELSYGEDGSVRAIRTGGSLRSLKHDVNGRLVEVVESDGTVIRYEYDPFGRRTAKVIGEDHIEFLWEVWELAAELRDGKIQSIFVSADLRPLAQWKDGRILTPILDHRGAVQEVFDEFNQLRWSCALDAYGNLLSETGDLPNPFRLRGQYQDAETGFYYNYSRHYDPRLGDYTSPDPIGIKGGYHFYAYPRNPLRWDDPYGLICGVAENHPPDEDPHVSTTFLPGKPVGGTLPGGAPAPEGLGSTGRTEPNSLKEQMAMGGVVNSPASGTPLPITMTDPRWPATDGWVKMRQNVDGVEIHYVYNPTTGKVDDYKFKN